jgi:hypothetical protein|tara:strand:+ start:285 stop:806 length:522 start_codon:yes stop_codon:yes gene_type:complete
MKQKKAAMELSVTAIVTLILAIVMLGLGLGFIRGMFTKVSTSFEEQISAEPEAELARSSDPLTISRQTIISEAGASIALKVNAYNPTKDEYEKVVPDIRCKDTDGAALAVTATGTKRDIDVAETASYTVLVTVPDQVPGSYLCEVVLTKTPSPPGTVTPADDLLQKDITLRIQ